MRDRRGDAEVWIDRVLRALGEAEPIEGVDPAQGFEERVLLAARERAAARNIPKRGAFAGLALAPWWYATAAAAVLVVAALVWAGHEHRARGAAHGLVAHTQSPRVAAPVRPPLGATHVADAGAAEIAVRVRPALARSISRPRAEEPHGWTLALQNHPAPEAPLTDEERLLLRIARRGRPAEFVALDPAVADARLVAEQAEFRGFFEPPEINTKEKSE